MASKTEKHRILSGSMNLVPPGDKIDPSESLLLDNWRVDLAGQLTTRGAAAVETGAPAPIGTGTYHTLTRTSNSRYSGIGTELWWGPEPSGAIKIGTGFDGNPIDTAFYQGFGWGMNRGKQARLNYNDPVHKWGVNAPSTAPVATVGQQPTTMLEPYNGTSGLNHVEASTDGITWLVEMDADVPADSTIITTSFTPDVGQDPAGSIDLLVSAACSMFIRDNFTPPRDTTFNGVAADDDVLDLFIFASDPTAIKSMTVRLSNLAADGVTEAAWVEANFASGSSWDPVKVLSQTPQSWSQIPIRRVLNVDKFQQQIAAATSDAATALTSQLSQLLHSPTLQIIAGGEPQVLAQNNTPATPVSSFDWTKVGRLVISFVLTAACEIRLNDAQFIGAEAASLTGSYQWFVSFFNNVGQDGNPSPISNTLVLNGESAILNNLPVDTDPDTVGRFIYRIGGSSSLALRVATIYDNVTTGPFPDPFSDEEAQDTATVMPIDRELPPAGKGVIGPIFGKLIAWSTTDHPARIFWTSAGIPWGFKGPRDPVVGNWEDVGQDDDEVVNCTNHKTLLVIYKQRSIWRVNGDIALTGVDPVQTNSNVGLVGFNAVCSGGALDYFVGPEGVYRFNMDYETKISGALDPIFKGNYTKLSSGDVIPPMDKQGVVNCAIALANDRLRVAYPEFGHTLPNVVLVCHLMDPQNLASLPTYQWARERYNGLAAPAFSCMNYEGTGRYLCGASTASDGGRLYNLELLDYRADNGNTFHAVYQSRFEDQELPDNFKIYSDLEIDFETAIDLTISGAANNSAVSTLSIYLIFDNLVKILIGTISSPTRTTQVLRIPVDAVRAAQGNLYGYRAKNVSVRIEGDIQATSTIYGTYLHWYPEERTADTFDTGPTALNTPERVKEVDYIEVYSTASGQQVQRALWSDLPGSILAARDVSDYTAPQGRGNYRQRLATAIDGRNFRLVLANDPTGSTMQIHQARLRGRVIGEYIDGTLNPPEYYESPEFSVAPGRVGELKDFLLDYDVSGPGGQFVLYSDLPGHALAQRTTLAIPHQSGRAPYVFPLENPAAFGASHDLPAGQLFKVRLYPPPGGVLRLHGRAAFRARVIGVYFEGGNGEIWETQDLDLLGGMGIFRQLFIDAETSGPMTLQMLTELPNQDMRPVGPSILIDSSGTTERQLPMYVRLPGNTKGHQQRFVLSGNATCRLYICRVLGRRLEVNGGAWDWVSLPVEPTPSEWASIQMPVRETPAEFTWMDLPVDTIE